MPTLSAADPALALRWLSQARQGVVVVQLLLLALTHFGTHVRVPLAPVLCTLGVVVAFDLVERARLARRSPAPAVVLAHAAFDLGALTIILVLTGGAQNPLQAFYLVEVALLAVLLPGRTAWGATAAAIVLQAAATLLAIDVPGLDDEPHHHVAHLAGHVLAFDLAAVAVTAFVGRLSTALRTSEAERAQAERLAALGTLAAGTAHALGTPLGAIELLAEEVAAAGPGEAPEAHAELVAQLRRCRVILDRMLAGDGGSEGRTERIGERIVEWVETWRSGQPGSVAVAVDVEPLALRVRGDEDGWRNALWTLLDNARAAGAPIRVSAQASDGRVVVSVEDSGAAVPSERLARAGQPFFSGWPDRKGAGLGVYVARTFARAASGDVTLEPRGPVGARATLSMAVEGG